MRRYFSIFVLTITLLGVAPGCASIHPAIMNRAYQDDLEGAKKLVSSSHLKQAVDELTQLIDMDPKNSEALLLRGVAYQGLEEFERAVRDYEAVLAIDPRNVKGHYNLGMIFAYKLNDPVRALKHFDRFLSLQPDHDRAFRVAKVMCAIDTDRSRPLLENGGLASFLGEVASVTDPADRRKRLLEAAEKNRSSPVLPMMIGQTYDEEGRTDEAIRAYQQALELRPTCAPCHEALGKLLIRKKKTEEGNIHILKSQLFNPNGNELKSSGD